MINTVSTSSSLTTVVFDVGMVLLEWDPRHLYRKIFADPAEMEWFLAHVCTGEWNVAQDRGRPWPDAEAEATVGGDHRIGEGEAAADVDAQAWRSGLSHAAARDA